jgi:Na+-transporting NADH:ubiquinone oxidoreductase subunit NqrB
MKQLIILAMMAMMPAGITTIHNSQAEQMVYICTGGSSKKYHANKNCRGLKNCSGQIRQISVKKAIDMGRTACKICYEN